MAKDSSGGRKGRQETLSNGRSHKRNKRRPSTIASKTVLKIQTPPAPERATSVKLHKAMGNEVKERLDNWRDSNNEQILIDMLVKSILICNKYSLYNASGNWQSAVQGVRRALIGKCEDEFDKLLLNEINN